MANISNFALLVVICTIFEILFLCKDDVAVLHIATEELIIHQAHLMLGVCGYGYYDCVGYKWCCPDGYKCTSYSDCYKRIYYSSGSSNVGAIVGGVIGGLVGLVFHCGCMCACCSKLSDACCTGKVESTNSQSDGQNTTRATENRQQTDTRLEPSHPTQIGPSIPSASDPEYPPPSYHL